MLICQICLFKMFQIAMVLAPLRYARAIPTINQTGKFKELRCGGVTRATFLVQGQFLRTRKPGTAANMAAKCANVMHYVNLDTKHTNA